MNSVDVIVAAWPLVAAVTVYILVFVVGMVCLEALTFVRVRKPESLDLRRQVGTPLVNPSLRKVLLLISELSPAQMERIADMLREDGEHDTGDDVAA